MQFIKFKTESERSHITSFLPTENWQYSLVCHLVEKTEDVDPTEPVEGEVPEKREPAQSIVFESPSFVRTIQKEIKGQKFSNNGKFLTNSFENKEIDSPYQAVVTEPEDIKRILEWLNANLALGFQTV